MIKSLYPKPLSYTEYLIDKVKYNFLPDSLRFKLLFKETIKKKKFSQNENDFTFTQSAAKPSVLKEKHKSLRQVPELNA